MEERKLRSTKILSGVENSMYRALYKSMGYANDDLSRPMIGIANSWNTLVPGHFNLNQVSEHVKWGIYRAGGTPVEFGVIGACDGVANGHDGMHFILPSREIICNSVEICVQAHRLDAIVLLASCDKIVPGMLMAAARLDIPAIMVHGGPMGGGVEFDGRKTDLTSIDEALGMFRAGKISEQEFSALEDLACPSCGSCAFLGTANTMCCLTEAMGMALPGSALIPATHSDRLRAAKATGVAICNLVEKGYLRQRNHQQKIPGKCGQGMHGHQRVHQRSPPPVGHRLRSGGGHGYLGHLRKIQQDNPPYRQGKSRRQMGHGGFLEGRRHPPGHGPT